MLKSYNTEPIHNLPIEYRSTSKQHETKQPAIFNFFKLYITSLHIMPM